MDRITACIYLQFLAVNVTKCVHSAQCTLLILRSRVNCDNWPSVLLSQVCIPLLQKGVLCVMCSW